ncbi:P-loop containing nucleoside triphosphate hydrolase protein [Dendrothele bispora CBS 962.96]|uniref:P-loop containing nucleoside triphosphate hydrolase protein n=1 Tax=Dendrothele bispora (strain CBS 962.96) TaxID=1314807 RepID=A0A4S8MF82_DENBC|nr:P-loop containing nucleoside triphosphate hydrolase protein [Dendrothele bispora CBS 962.96]
MDSQAGNLAQILVELLEKKPPASRLLVGLFGIPASGKSTFAVHLTQYTNELLESRPNATDRAVLVGLDGWHLTRAQLDRFPDPKLAHDRRGIHWTFDGPGYLEFIKKLREEVTSTSSIIFAPSFDHALKDPSPDAVSIHPHHRIIIIEGLYAALSVDSWAEAGQLLDERWYLEVSIEEAQRRLVKRHVISGVAKDHEEAVWRAEQNDMPNGRFIIANMVEPIRIIQSLDDPEFASPQSPAE